MQLNSPAFEDGGSIPEKYTRIGDNALPPLEWSSSPEGAKSYALLVEDPDAPQKTFLHCLLYDIPADNNRLDDSSLRSDRLDSHFASNDFGNAGYDGPEPPRDHGPHRYQFRLAALDVPKLDLADSDDAGTVWRQVCIHSVGMANLTGVYEAH